MFDPTTIALALLIVALVFLIFVLALKNDKIRKLERELLFAKSVRPSPPPNPPKANYRP